MSESVVTCDRVLNSRDDVLRGREQSVEWGVAAIADAWRRGGCRLPHGQMGALSVGEAGTTGWHEEGRFGSGLGVRRTIFGSGDGRPEVGVAHRPHWAMCADGVWAR